jgi:competence CoiA-like predicted nuclease
MPELTEAIEIKVTVETKIITITDALKQRGTQRGTEYYCPKCGKAVIPHRQYKTGAAAHFEHHKGESCSGKK